MIKLSTKSDESDLIAGLRNQDPYAVELLYDRYAPSLLGLICQIVKDDTMAHALLKTSFLYIGQHICDLDPDRQRLFPWLMSIARQQALPYYKSQPTVSFNASTMALKSASQRTLTEQIIEQQYVLGKSQQQVADALQIPLAVVRQQTQQGLMR